MLKFIQDGGITGIKMYVDGVVVAGFADVVGKDGKIYKPAEQTSILARR